MKKIFLIFIALILICNPLYAQEARKGLIYVIEDFSGGLATNLNPIGLPKKYGVVVQNIRINDELKSLTKRNKLLQYGSADSSEAITGMHRVYFKNGTKKLIVTHGDEFEVGTDSTGNFTSTLALATSDYRWQWATWHDLAIGCDGYNPPVKYDGTVATYLGTCGGVDKGSGAGPDGTYKYKVSFYTTSYEVIFDVASNLVTTDDNDVTLTMIPIAPTTYGGEDVIGRKIYRSDDGGAGTYNLVPTTGTIADNTTTTIDDSEIDGAVDAKDAYPSGDATYTPPTCKLLVIHKNRLFFANDPNYPSRIYRSEDGSHDVFIHTTNYHNIRLNDGDEITFAKNLLGRLCIGKTNTIQYLYTNGTDPVNDWAISDPFSFVGNAAMYSAANTPLGIMYLARDGLNIFNGQNSKLISNLITPTIDDIAPSNFGNTWGECSGYVYLMAYTSKTAGGSTNNRVLIYDLINSASSIDIANINAFCTFDSGTDWGELYAGASDDGEVFTYEAGSQQVQHAVHADFTGTWDDMRYIPDSDPVEGDSESPILEIAWDCTIDGWLTELQAKDGDITNIDDIGTEQPTFDIDRPDTGGTYVSQSINTKDNSVFDKIYWNEVIPTGNDVTFAIRSEATDPPTGAYSSEVTTASGSDISNTTNFPPNEYTQYRITMSTDSILETPTVTRVAGYNVKYTYSAKTTDSETSVAFEWESGELDFGYPGYIKTLRKLYLIHDGTLGNFTVTFTNEDSITDTFTIALSSYNTDYFEYFTDGAFLGELIKIEIKKNDLYDFTFRKLIIIYDLEPII